MDPELVAKSLCFHGQPLQKIWEGERGNVDLPRLGLSAPDYSIYSARQKTLTFQDRAKRLKLHQFVARKAPVLFDTSLVNSLPSSRRKERSAEASSLVIPPFEAFLSKSIDKANNIHILGAIQPGEIIYGQISNRNSNGLTVKILCTGEPVIRYLADMSVKGYILNPNLVPAHDKKGNPRQYSTNDYVCCEVLDISADADRMTLGMKGALTIDPKAPLGVITYEQLPDYFRKTMEDPEATYDQLLEKSKFFKNPSCLDILFQEVDLDICENFSNLSGLRNRFAQNEYATELRQVQASKWAFRSVADGIEHFKVGRHSEAFQCLNKALSIDPRNVEGLVARGALYANSGSFKKAVDDFEVALKLNPYHANARKYMGETLVALGRSYEEENRIEEARIAYLDCLKIIPSHEEAKNSLEFLNGRTGKQVLDTSNLMIPALKLSTDLKKDSPAMNKNKEDGRKEKHAKKKKSKSRKRRNSTSSSSTEDSSKSSESSSESTNSTGTSKHSSESNHTPKKKKNLQDKKQKSLSPLSKRMALMGGERTEAGSSRYQFNQPFHLASSVPLATLSADDYDLKVKNFLDMTKDEDDYEQKVRKLVEEASKYRKERKMMDEKSKKKEKKKQKKMKKESKKEKRRKEKKEKMHLAGIDDIELQEALKIFKSLPGLDDGNKLNADLAKYEKSIESLQKVSKTKIPDELPAKVFTKQETPSKGFATEYSIFQQRVSNQQEDRKFEKKPSTTDSKHMFPAAVNFSNASKRPTTPPLPQSGAKELQVPAQTPVMAFPPKQSFKIVPPKPPVVLDKFGCFRLATFDEQQLEAFRRQSRSRSRSRSHRRSRSPRRSRSTRRSRSRSGGRWRRPRRSPSPRRRSRTPRRSRSRNRSSSRPRRRSPIRPARRDRRSRSFSRSRSGSPPPWSRGSRWGGNKGRGRGVNRVWIRGGRGGHNRNRFPLSPPFRGGRNYDEPKRRSIEDLNDGKRSRRNDGNNVTDGIDGKWTHDKYDTEKGGEKSKDISLEEIDKAINKAQKERKDGILQRDKDLLKKQVPTNVPF